MVVVPPGYLVNVQVPDDGNPDNGTLPVEVEQVGWVIVPTDGAEGKVYKVIVPVALTVPHPPVNGML